jgi:hypothetical protein
VRWVGPAWVGGCARPLPGCRPVTTWASWMRSRWPASSSRRWPRTPGWPGRSDWRQFTRWARLRELAAGAGQPGNRRGLPGVHGPAHQQTGEWLYAPSTLGRRLAAIAWPTSWPGWRPRAGTRSCPPPWPASAGNGSGPPGGPLPCYWPICGERCSRSSCGSFRRRSSAAALLPIGFAGAFRRSELTALTVADVALHPQDALHVRMRRSKTDQEGRGSVKALPYGTNPDTCPPCTYLRWRQVLDTADADGRVGILTTLRQRPGDATPTGHLCRVVGLLPDDDRRRIGRCLGPCTRPDYPELTRSAGMWGRGGEAAGAAAGLNAEHLSGHSLRTGFVTQAVRGGADSGAIMRQTEYRSSAMVELYRRENAPLLGNALTALGL